MAVRYMIDSDTLSYVMKGRDLQLRERFSKKLRQMSISSVVFAEIAYGLNKKASRRYQAVLDTLLEIVPVESWSRHCAEEYAKIRGDLEREGTPIGVLDMMIAAAAKVAGATLVTNNTAHFSRVKGLKTENWVSNSETEIGRCS